MTLKAIFHVGRRLLVRHAPHRNRPQRGKGRWNQKGVSGWGGGIFRRTIRQSVAHPPLQVFASFDSPKVIIDYMQSKIERVIDLEPTAKT